jgi:hypothetical protein
MLSGVLQGECMQLSRSMQTFPLTFLTFLSNHQNEGVFPPKGNPPEGGEYTIGK